MGNLIPQSRKSSSTFAPNFFVGVSESRRQAAFKAIQASGSAQEVCSKVSEALGAASRDSGKAACLALVRLRGAASRQACEDSDLPESAADACRDIFRLPGQEACFSEELKIFARSCEKLLIETFVRMDPDYVRLAKNLDARAAAMEEFKFKRAELDSLVEKIGAGLRGNPLRDKVYKANAARYARVRAGAANVVDAVQTKPGR